MPKMKTHSGAVKRFKPSANRIKKRSANRGHILTKKTSKRKRQLRSPASVASQDVRNVRNLLLLGV